MNSYILFPSEGMIMQTMTVSMTFQQDATWRQEPVLIKSSRQNCSTPVTNLWWKQSNLCLRAQQCVYCIYSLLLVWMKSLLIKANPPSLTLVKCFAQMFKSYEKNCKTSWFYTWLYFLLKQMGFFLWLVKPIFICILIISIPSVQFNYWFISLFSKISISVYLITVSSEECK